MQHVTFDASKDTTFDDQFGPITPDCLRLASYIQIHEINTEESIDSLLNLIDQPVIGFDIEWKPNLTKFVKLRPSLLQISDFANVYMIDLLMLGDSTKLDKTLIKIFTNEISLKLGINLRGDLTRIRQYNPQMSFTEHMVKYMCLGLLH